MIFKDSYELIRKCKSCQTFSGKMKRVVIPLQSSMVEKPFIQWGLDMIGPINPKYSKGHSYIVTTTNYFMKWKEATSFRNIYSDHLIHFLKKNILSRFGVPEKFITNNDSIFVRSKFTIF
jgi:hypothetical protein